MKRVRVTCHEPIVADPAYRQPWADVWVTFTGKPGRRRYEFAPTLLSRPELDVDLSDARDEANSDIDSPEKVERLESIATVLQSQRVYVDPIQTLITRMSTRQRHGVTVVRLKSCLSSS